MRKRLNPLVFLGHTSLVAVVGDLKKVGYPYIMLGNLRTSVSDCFTFWSLLEIVFPCVSFIDAADVLLN